MNNGEVITLSKEGHWGFYRLMHLFSTNSPHQYTYTHQDHSWHFSIKAIPHLPISLIGIHELIEHMPDSEWQSNIFAING